MKLPVAPTDPTILCPSTAGWYVCAPRTSHFEIRVSPLFGSLTKKRFASAYDDVLVWLYVDGAVCNVEGNIATKHSDIVYQGIKQIADGDTTVVSRFMFQAAKMTEEEAVRKGEGDGGQDEVGTIRLVFKGAYKGKHEPIGYERYQNHVHKARAKVTEKEAIKKGKSLGVGKGAALNVKRSKHADFEYPEHLQTELFEHEIVIRLRECFWMESRKLVDVKGRACTHSMSGREVKGESSGKRPRLQSDWDLGIKNEDGIIDLC
ncbi:hypothetical protein SARC_02470 [Sphaeroforma arctica JP610]|uniref:Uncharacterized protein n=1 Tax=Sphaeroforma arctica JP610 TaxID=667725 RepID=A0A0L0GAQ8_9EUKA|nr:hypothetical protein SARC_02470 [Sphaeroforma arctica JP610]KNC85348.1 hypothetical protein SARC_02470 [Sphaeroforma arctica JP610]|eukprot:XP_014159250.1 hypothetical protein SARC_02470 [Sphaeroforma arctica JP610]